MCIEIYNNNNEIIYIGCADEYLYINDNDTELEDILTELDYNSKKEIVYNECIIYKTLELI